MPIGLSSPGELPYSPGEVPYHAIRIHQYPSVLMLQDALDSSCGFSFVAALTSKHRFSKTPPGKAEKPKRINSWAALQLVTLGIASTPHSEPPTSGEPLPMDKMNFDVFKKGV